ncbi:hypothetical protein PF005_g22832 [Phytophthora fragariae]|uniref:WRC domain-containing protein n=1 Tax=Phytophthora fragariae TaxID=53985 RepID=A0A6A3RUV7_9STRA|nr:hypothetical protein PF003_g8891 [Phytophthora fragariae]KAE8926188.1 hypothetical protein PF009_g23620 [Phytophthora fragariae]KAE8982604.1 hypothetical protein PF011_g21547 [Phytophthora fragariae]KAE9080921.1 hypothetical protein PF007_g22855 [Phytophthora fragariae]KAE9104101.1 hypothetical protein PF006_g22004 [Phytophthora fragariae]
MAAVAACTGARTRGSDTKRVQLRQNSPRLTSPAYGSSLASGRLLLCAKLSSGALGSGAICDFASEPKPHPAMVTTTTYSSGELLSSFARHSLQPMPSHVSHMAIQPAPVLLDPQQKRSPLLCGYPSKKCWSWRVEKRNGELHKFCEYHRQKANTNQRRMEQRRKQGRSASPRAKNSGGARRSHKVAADAKRDVVVKLERPAPVSKAITHPKAVVVPVSNSGSPRGIDCFGNGRVVMDDAAMFSWMDAELDIGIGMDAAVDYMMVDTPVIDMEPSDTPVDLFEEDLFFLEHFIDEISHSAV